MSDFGEMLRKGREDRGITLGEVAEATKIRRIYLEALERGDLQSLPGSTSARGFVRAFAQHVGMDPAALVEAYAREEERLREDGTLPPADPVGKLRRAARLARHGRRVRAAKLATVVLLIGAGLAVAWMLGRDRGREPVPTPKLVRESTPFAAPESRPEMEPPPEAVDEETHSAGAVPQEEPPPEEPVERVEPPVAPGSMRIDDYGVGTEIVDRELAGRATVFPEGFEVWFWTRIVGGKPGDRIRHVWLYRGWTAQTLEFEIGGPHWRVYSSKTLVDDTVGTWTVEARDVQGQVLARSEFRCSAPDAR